MERRGRETLDVITADMRAQAEVAAVKAAADLEEAAVRPYWS
jgi:hypothetical protein